MASVKHLKKIAFINAKIILLGLIFFIPQRLSAQIDREFWFAAPYVNDEGRSFDKPIVLQITTLSAPATVTVSMPADPTFTPIISNVAANSALSLDLTTWINQIEDSPANTVLNKGLLIKSTADITAYYDVVSSFCNCDPEIFSLKGKNALGNEFYISSQYSYDESPFYAGTNGFEIVATQNNTHVTITPTKDIIGHPANVPFTVTLNTGQTYSAVATSALAGGHLEGSYVTADQPIAVTLKDDLVQVSSCADLIGDQTVPTSVLGSEYIVMQGFLQPYDSIYVLAIADGTAVYQDGNATPIATLAKGQSLTINLTNSSTYIKASNKIYVYHLTGNGCESGSAIIPKINCTGSRSINIVRSSSDLFAVMVVVKVADENNFTVNGNKTLIPGIGFAPVPGTGGAYVSQRVDLSNAVPIGTPINFSNSTGNFSLGFINGGTNDGTVYGFFSDFKSSSVQSSQAEDCQGHPVQLNAFGGVKYRWTPVAGLNDPTIANPRATPASTTTYKVIITSPEGCIDSATVKVIVNVAYNVDSTVGICSGDSYKLPSGKSVNASGTYHDTVRYASGCDSLITTLHLTVTTSTTSLKISADQSNICSGTPVTFTAAPTNPGSSPVYQWQVNGTNAGTNSKTFNSSSLANGDKITCILTSNTTCEPNQITTSNTVTMTVNTTAVPSVSIAASPNNVCVGALVTFTATPVIGGSAPVYQWFVNGVGAGTNSSTFSSSTFSNGDKVSCIMTSNATCATPVTATSNSITVNVNPLVTPTVSIAVPANNICPGTIVTFTAIPSNGGGTPVYQWLINGNNAGTNSPTFTSSTLVNGDIVSCRLTSSAACLATPDATSNTISMTVNAPIVPAVSIKLSQNNICAGTPVTFTATPVNGGSAPSYQWQVNGVAAGTNNAIFSSSALANGDVVSCVMTSNAGCATPANVTSNSIVMNVTALVASSVSIAASQNNFCPGTTVTFTATPVNGGGAPAYQWLVNGNNAGTNSATLSGSNFSDGDKISCTITSNATCATPNTATSNILTVNVSPFVTPAVNISASANSICPGTPVTFTATPVNGGIDPVYQWFVNGNGSGTNSPLFSSSAISNGDMINCRLTSNANCVTTPDATSNNITMTVNAPIAPAVNINVSENNVCAGTPVTFTATPTNGGATPAYQWLVNGVDAGTNNVAFTSSLLANGDKVSCIMTSNATCATPETATSNSITMGIFPLPVVDGGGDKTIKQGNSTTLTATVTGNIADITWSPSTGLDDNKILNPIASPLTTTLYTITVQTTDGCSSTGSVKVIVLEDITIPNTFTPNGDGVNDRWDIKNLKDYQNCFVQVFNRWGTEVYHSTGYATPWDGTLNGKRLPIGTYYYVINLNNNTSPLAGFVLMIR